MNPFSCKLFIHPTVKWGDTTRWMDHILNYFFARETSGFVEGFNNKIKVLKRRSYGITNVAHLFQRIYLDIEGYRLFA